MAKGNYRSRRNYTLFLAAAAASSGLIQSITRAASLTWNGGSPTSDNWSDPSNWNGLTPNAGDQLSFGGTTRLTPSNDVFAGVTFSSVTFNPGAGPFVLGGQGITIGTPLDGGSGAQLGGNITNNDGAGVTQTFAINPVFNRGRHDIATTAGSGGLNFGTGASPVSISRNPNAILVFSTAGGAINVTNSDLSNDGSDGGGILGGWATIGDNFATRALNGNIVAYSAYTDINTGNINNVFSNNVRYINATGNITVPAGITTINTLLYADTGTTSGRTLTLNGTLKLGGAGTNSAGIFHASGASGPLTINGTGALTVSGGGELTLSSGPFNINTATNGIVNTAPITNDGANTVSVNSLGYVQSNINSSFTGGLTIVQGRFSSNQTSGFGAATNVVTVLPGAEAFFNNGNTNAQPLVISGIGPTETSGGMNLGAVRMNTNGTILSGLITLAGDSRISGGMGGTNTLAGRITGPYRLELTAALGSPLSVTVSNTQNDWTGGLQITATSAHNIPVVLGNSNVIPDGGGVGGVNLSATGNGIASLNINGHNETINALSANGGTGTVVTNSGGAATLSVGNDNSDFTFGGQLTGNLSLEKVGAGTMTINSPSGISTHTGTTTVTQGTLALNPSSGSNPIPTSNINVTTGTLDVSSIAGSGLTLGTQILTNNNVVIGKVIAAAGSTVKGTGTFNNLLTLSGSGPTGANSGVLAPGNGVGQINLGAGLTVSGNGQLSIDIDGNNADFVNVTGAASVAGLALNLSTFNNHAPSLTTYTLLQATSLTGVPTLNNTMIGRQTVSLDMGELASNLIVIHLAGTAGNIRWDNSLSGTGNGSTWDNTLGGTSQNWTNPATGPSPVADSFFVNDNVFFTDTNNTHYTVNIAAPVAPGSVTITNNSGNYVFNGVGSIISGSLAKSGNSALTINTSGNTYGGGTTLSGGTLNIGSPNTSTAPTLGTGALTIGNNTILDSVVGAPSTLANDIAQTWAGNFTFTGTNSLNLGVGAVTLAANPTITVSNNTLTVGGTISDGSGNSITKAGNGTLALNGANSFSGGVTVNAGTVRLGSGSGAGGGNITVNPNGTLVTFGTMSNTIALAGGKLAGTTGSTTALSSDVTVSANSNIFIQDPAVSTSPVDAVEFQINGNLQGSGNINLTTGPDNAPDTGNGFRLRGTGTTNYSGILIVNNNIKAELQDVSGGSYSPLGTGKIRLAAGAALLGGTVNTGDAITPHLTDGYSELNLRNNAGSDVTFGNDLEITGTGLAVLNTLGNAGGQTIMGNLTTGANQEVGIYLAAGGAEHTLVFPTVTITGNAKFSPKINGFGAANSVGSDMALGPISESGVGGYSVTMNGLRTLQLNGSNAFTGGLIINSGVVQLGDPGALNSTTPQSVTFGPGVPPGTTLRLNGNSVIVPAIQTNATAGSAVVEAGATTATLTVNSAAPSTFVGVMQDGGSPLNLIKSGGSTFVLGSDNTYSGTTTVGAGTLQVGNGGAAGSLGGGAVSVSANLAFNRSDSFTYAGAITGSGNLSQTGSDSTMTLTGANSIATTTVNAGTLVVANPGSLTSAVTLSSGAVLAGDGTISTVNLSAGSIHPGASAADGVVGAMPLTTLNATGGDLRFDLTTADSAAGTNNGVHDVISATNVTFSGSATSISPFFTSGIPTAGNYTLIVSTNPIAHTTNPTISLAGSRLTPTIQFLSGGTILNLNITGSGADKTWVGNINGNWNVNSTPNWNLSGGDNLFFNLDSVTFDDSTAAHNVMLTQNVTPTRMIVNTGSSYTIDTNGFAISGQNASLYVQSGALVLKNTGAAATNTFGGPINLDNGTTLELQSGGTIGTGAISATSANLKINRSGTMTIANSITGPVNLTVDSGGDVTLSGNNAIPSGNIAVANGALRANSATALPAIANNVTLGSGANAGTLDLKGINLNSVKNLNTAGSNTSNTITNSSATAASTINFIGDTNPSVFNGVVTVGAGGRSVNLSMTGGTLTLAGGALDTSSGSMTVLGGGALTIGPSTSLFSGDLTLGFRDLTTSNGGTIGNLTLQNTSTAATLSVPSNSASADVVNIASGKTLNVTGRVALGTPSIGGQGGANTVVTFTGGGSLNITTTTNSGFYVGVSNMPDSGSATTDRNVARVDMTGLTNFTYSTGATGTGTMGVGWAVRPDAQLRLPPGNNLIQANSLHIGDSSITPGLANIGTGDNAGGTPVLFLGTGTNTIDTASIIIGTTKGSGQLNWQGTTGSLTLRGQDGTATSRSDITIGSFTTGSATTVLSSALLAGHNVDAKVGTLQIGRLAGATGSATGNLVTFDTGTFDVNNLQIGVNVNAASTNGADGVFTLGTSSTSTGTLTVNTQFALGLDTNTSAAPTKARFNVLGGTANINANLAVTDNDSDAGNVFAVTLDGGTLNMMSHTIGDATRSVTLTASSGTLKNVTQINNGTGLTKGSTGTLTLDGTNTFTGPTAVSAGTLQYATSHTTGSALNVSDGARALLPHSAATPNLVVVRTGSITTNTTGHVDIGDNKLIVTGTGATGSWTGSTYTGVTGLIASGRGTGNFWDGTVGIVTSQSAAVGGNFTTIGVARASDIRPATATATGTWSGQTITGTDTLVMYTYGGDATLDGKINVDDYIRIDSGIAAGLTGWSNGDFNYDGKVNIDDYTQFIDANIGTQGAQFPTTGGTNGMMGGGMSAVSGVSAVPEPAGLMLAVSLAAPALFGRRRRRAMN